MKHPLSDMFRKLADSQFCAVCNQSRSDCEMHDYGDENWVLRGALRDAAETLDSLSPNLDRVQLDRIESKIVDIHNRVRGLGPGMRPRHD